MSVCINVKSLSKSYLVGNQKVDVLKNINLDLKRGEFYSIMGPSGSGKSTLLYLLGGLDKPTDGSVSIDGAKLSEMNDRDESEIRRNKLGFIFQFYNLVPNMTVEQNVLLPILLDGGKAKDYKSKVDELLELVGLQDKKKYTPKELSGGQQQRVAIARALINDPDIILADEPIGNLDSKSGEIIMKLLQRINKEQGKTIVQVTHSLESTSFGTKIINIKDGIVQ
ncbi:ABC transporter ATP-binding protein [Clostridium paraputrificum]|uniref:ABC transporter ATP-binding protein n=1 Tax=Clostridium paraputrificum TaxID=29363 RepID=UPI003D32857E